jgi:capsular polysaccharide export protein
MRRSLLVSQGTASPFLGRLTVALRRREYVVRRVDFCGGDLLYAGSAADYTGCPDELPNWYAGTVAKYAVTDISMFCDCREIHRHMPPVAARSCSATLRGVP